MWKGPWLPLALLCLELLAYFYSCVVCAHNHLPGPLPQHVEVRGQLQGSSFITLYLFDTESLSKPETLQFS